MYQLKKIKENLKETMKMNFVLEKTVITTIICIIIQISPIITTNSRTRLTPNETTSLLEKINLVTASTSSINDWFDRLNDQYRLLSQIIAAIAWELR